MLIEDAVRAWRAILGDTGYLVESQAQLRYGPCTAGVTRRILGALLPGEGDQVAEIVRVAGRFRVPLYPISTGHNWGYGTANPASDQCVILDLGGMRKIRRFDAESGIVTLEPGVTQADLAAFLAAGGHPYLVPVTGAGPTCSIVGNALERGYGVTPWADHFGAVTSLEVVLADGSVYRPGLAQMGAEWIDSAFKWGIGPYLDGLFTQSGFGVVTAMSLALARRPSGTKAFFFWLKEDKQLEPAIAAVREILSRLPGIVGAINVMNQHRVLSMAVPYPRDRLGSDGLIPDEVLQELGRANQIFAWTGFGTLYGEPGVVKAAQREIRRLLKPVNPRLLFVSLGLARRLNVLAAFLPGVLRNRLGKSTEMLQRSLELVEGRPNETAMPLCYWKNGREPAPGRPTDPALDGCGLIWYAPLVPMKPERVREYVTMVDQLMRAHRLEPLITLTSVSDRCFDSTVPLLFELDSKEELANAEKCYWALMRAGQAKGIFPYRVGVNSMEWLTSQGGSYWEMVARLKQLLDPDDILSPGRYAPKRNAG